ncbi:MAG: hypothetical protein ACYSUV_21055 [Planctomycetota bacterium]|jgi:hypothetical protein
MNNIEISIIRIMKDIYDTYGKLPQLELLALVEKRLELEQNRTQP